MGSLTSSRSRHCSMETSVLSRRNTPSGMRQAGVICCANLSQLKIIRSWCWPTPKFDRDLHAQIAKRELPTEGSGVLRGTEKRDFEDMSFADLGGTQQESDQLLGQFKGWGWSAKSFTGAEVTKQVLWELHGPYILHLATHGFFEPEDPTLDANPTESQSPTIKFDFAKARFFKH